MSLQFTCCYTILLLSPTLSTNCKEKKNIIKGKAHVIIKPINILRVDLKPNFIRKSVAI